MIELIRFIRALYIICINSEKKEITVDADTLKQILDDLKKIECAIPVNGRKWGENDVREFGQGRPEWCPMKEQEAVKPRCIDGKRNHFIKCGNCNYDLVTGYLFCPHCGQAVKWK